MIMADRYWVGGTGNWSDTAKWSTTSGGAGGASVPGSTDDVYFDANSSAGAFTVSIESTSRSCNNFIASGLSGTMTFAGSALSFNVTGSVFSLPATNFFLAMSSQLTFSGSAKTVDFNGNVVTNGTVAFNSNVTLLSAFTSTFQAAIQGGTLDLNGFTYTCRNLVVSTSGSKTVVYNGGSIVLTGSNVITIFDFTAGTLSFTDPNNGGIVLTSTTTLQRTLNFGAGVSPGTLTIGGTTGTSTLTIQGSNTFAAIESTKSVAHTIRFTDGTTQTVGDWRVRGTSGNKVTLTGTSTAGWTIALSSGDQVDSDFLNIQYSTATPADSWYAGTNSTDLGDNSGWTFTDSPDNFLTFFPAAGA
jgi:hypothetical protein